VEVGANITFGLTGNDGAALVTRYKTYKEDTMLGPTFRRYTKDHYESWVKFACDKGFEDVQPVLVSGFDITGDFEMVAYSYEDTTIEVGATLEVPMLASASASFKWSWHEKYPPYRTYGPDDPTPPPPEQTTDTPQKKPPSTFNQCVFIRYYTMRFKKLLGMQFPRVIRAGAGPRDLGPGGNTGGTPPAPMVQSDADSATSDDEDYGGQWAHTADTPDLQAGIVVRNTPYVWFLPCTFVSALNFAFRRRNMTSGVPLQTMCSR